MMILSNRDPAAVTATYCTTARTLYKNKKSLQFRRIKGIKKISGQLRNHHTMGVLGIPNVVEPEPEHVDAQADRAHAHVSNEELLINLKEEECCVSVFA